MSSEEKAVFQPYNLSRWRSKDVGAIALLALALGWSLVDKSNKAPIVKAHDGKIVELPDSISSLKMNVFRSWSHQIAAHSDDVRLPLSVVQQICQAAKLDHDHARVLLELADMDELVHIDEVIKEAEKYPEVMSDEEREEQEYPADGSKPYIVNKRPFMARGAAGTTYESEASNVITWSDGMVQYECKVCGKVYDTAKAVGSHRQLHIKHGTAKPVDQSRYTRKHTAKKKAAAKKATVQKTVSSWKPVQEAKAPSETEQVSVLKDDDVDVLTKVRILLIPEMVAAHNDKVAALQAELYEANAHIERLTGNLKALRDLLGDVE